MRIPERGSEKASFVLMHCWHHTLNHRLAAGKRCIGKNHQVCIEQYSAGSFAYQMRDDFPPSGHRQAVNGNSFTTHFILGRLQPASSGVNARQSKRVAHPLLDWLQARGPLERAPPSTLSWVRRQPAYLAWERSATHKTPLSADPRVSSSNYWTRLA